MIDMKKENEQMKKEQEQTEKEAESLKDKDMENVTGGVGIWRPPTYRPQGSR